MPIAQQNPWSKARTESTLRQLRKDYPGYTDNELYAIWCHEHGKIPVDAEGKVILDQWMIHAEGDGKYLDGGPFRVSRALFGRAKKARKGVAKPKRQVKAKQPEVAPEPSLNGKSALSPRALEFAQDYDKAAKLVNAIVNHRHEINDLVAELKGTKPLILQELAEASPETRDLLTEVGTLRKA